MARSSCTMLTRGLSVSSISLPSAPKLEIEPPRRRPRRALSLRRGQQFLGRHGLLIFKRMTGAPGKRSIDRMVEVTKRTFAANPRHLGLGPVTLNAVLLGRQRHIG